MKPKKNQPKTAPLPPSPLDANAEHAAHVMGVWHYVLLALATFLAYANIYDNDFLFDDDLIIRLNHFLRSWDTFGTMLTSSTTDGARIAGGFYRPMQLLLYFFVFQIGEMTKIGFHLLNVAIHIGNVCLAYGLGRKLGLNPTAIFFSLLIWALHPLHTEAITYMSATADPLFAFFCLLGLLILAPDFTPKKIFAVIPVFLLGLFSKETAIVFPALVVVCMYFVSAERLNVRIYLRTWPLWIVMGLYVWWRSIAPGFDGPQTFGHLFALRDYYNLKQYSDNPSWRIYTFFATLPAYLQLLVWPVDLHLERSFTLYASFMAWPVITGCVMTLATIGQVLWGRGRRGLSLSWGLLWFGAAHFPDTGLLIPMNSLFLEHWMYLPTVGLFMGIGQTISTALDKPQWQKLRYAAGGIALLIAAGFAARTYDQNTTWRDPITFYNHIFAYGEVSARARNNLALAYMDRGQPVKAIEQFKEAIAITDTYAETRYNYGLAILNLPNQSAHFAEAIDNFNKSIAIDPNFYRSYDALAKIYKYQGLTDKAEAYQKKADALMARSTH